MPAGEVPVAPSAEEGLRRKLERKQRKEARRSKFKSGVALLPAR